MKAFALFLLLTIAIPLLSQPESQDALLDRIADELFATSEGDVSFDELYETLAHLLANPVDLNKVNSEQLRAMMMLSEQELNAFLTYREKFGPLLSTLELQAIPNWSMATLSRMMPFVMVTEASAGINTSIFKRIAQEDNNYLVIRYDRTLENRKGFMVPDSANGYAGQPDKYYLRYRVSRTNDFSIGITAEQDPGEPLSWKPDRQQFGPDFFSAHVQLTRKGWIDNLILGDFQCQFGQGLQLGSVFGMGKNAEAITSIRRSNLGFMPYTSVSENLYMRGVALSVQPISKIKVHGFFSSKRIDATVDQEVPMISSLSSSGLHRTRRELEGQKQVLDQDAGLIIQFQSGTTDAGILAHHKSRDHSLVPEPAPYNHYSFKGDSRNNIGAYFNTSWSNITLFSEVAHTIGYGSAFTAGVLGNLTGQLEMAWLFRNFSVNYHADYANAFAESSTPQNEQGIYWGIRYRLNKKLSWSSYIDIFQFPWLRYRAYSPSEGSEWLLRFEYTPSRHVHLFFQAREESKWRNLGDETATYKMAPGTKRNVWLSCEVTGPTGLTIKTRVQGSQFEFGGSTTRGIAFIQDLAYGRGKWSLTMRYALFDTDDYDNRLYVSERDVWLTASLPAYDGVGVRTYVLLHYKISKTLDAWFRWARTAYEDRSGIGSGMDQIDGNTRNDAKFQVRIRF